TDKVHITVSDGHGHSGKADSTAIVVSNRISATGTVIQAKAGETFTGVVAKFTSPLRGATAGIFTASIAWGNGNTSSGQITQDTEGSFAVRGTQIFAKAGHYSVVVRIRGTNGESAVAATSATVSAMGNGGAGNQGSGSVTPFSGPNPVPHISSITPSIGP